MKTLALNYAATMLVLLALDAVWLTLTAAPLYHAQLGAMLLPTFRAGPAIAFYLLYGVGLVAFAGAPALAAGSWRFALTRGGLLGLVAYATYDLTNQATLRGWSEVVTLADLAWGTTLSATAATLGYLITRRFRPR